MLTRLDHGRHGCVVDPLEGKEESMRQCGSEYREECKIGIKRKYDLSYLLKLMFFSPFFEMIQCEENGILISNY